MTIKEVLTKTKKFENSIDYELILAYILDKPRWYLIAHNDRVLTAGELAKFRRYTKKLEAGMPVQYIIGSKEFMGFTFKVTKDVLIPRGDTEVLVTTIVDYCKGKSISQRPEILDLCTGSGCIGISLANFVNGSSVLATDVSEKALAVAKKNAYGVSNIRFLKSDLFANIDNKRKFDIIVSNPPYIETNVIDTLEDKVKKYEPKLALDGGVDGLDFYRRILNDAYSYMKPHGLLAFEIGYNQADKLNEYVENNHSKKYNSFKVIKDLNGNDRVILLKKTGGVTNGNK